MIAGRSMQAAAATLFCLALAGCGPEAAPVAAPGAVERTTEALDRNTAAEQAETTRSNDRDAEVRADAAARRIRDVGKTRSEGKSRP